MTWWLVSAVFLPIGNPLLRLIFTHWPCLQQNCLLTPRTCKQTQLFTFKTTNLITNTAQTKANRAFWPLPEAWNWQTEWKTTVNSTWAKFKIEMRQSKERKTLGWNLGSKWTNQTLVVFPGPPGGLKNKCRAQNAQNGWTH